MGGHVTEEDIVVLQEFLRDLPALNGKFANMSKSQVRICLGKIRISVLERCSIL